MNMSARYCSVKCFEQPQWLEGHMRTDLAWNYGMHKKKFKDRRWKGKKAAEGDEDEVTVGDSVAGRGTEWQMIWWQRQRVEQTPTHMGWKG